MLIAGHTALAYPPSLAWCYSGIARLTNGSRHTIETYPGTSPLDEGAPIRSEALPDRWHGLLVRLRCIAQPQIVCKALLAARLVGTVLVSLNQGDVWLSGHVTTRGLVKSLLTPINSIEQMTSGNDKRFSGEIPGAYRRSQTGIWRHSLS